LIQTRNLIQTSATSILEKRFETYRFSQSADVGGKQFGVDLKKYS
jgi:hypothetical protein